MIGWTREEVKRVLLSRVHNMAGHGDFLCPICGSVGHVMPPDRPGDIFCEGDCSDGRVRALIEDWLTLPPTCPEASRKHDRWACLYCQRHSEAVRAMTRRQLAEVVEDDDEGWAPQSLVDAPPVPEPTILRYGSGLYLLRRGWLTLVHGEFGSGKTPLCYLAVVEQVEAGNLAMIVDHEMGPSGVKALLNELGLTDAEIEAGVYYSQDPPPMGARGRRQVVEAVEAYDRELTVVVIDSLTESMAMVGGTSDNDAQDVTTWANSLPKWLRNVFDAAVVMIDHSGVNDGPRPSGSHKKREIPQFHVWVDKEVDFSRQHERGLSLVKPMKDRSGDLVLAKPVAHLRTRLGGSFYLREVDPALPGEVAFRGDLQPEDATDADVLRDLVAAGSGGVARTELTGSGARGRYRRDAVARLLGRGLAREWKEGRFQKVALVSLSASIETDYDSQSQDEERE